MTTPLERARSRAAKELLAYIYQVRHEREPQPWEWAIGLALLGGELTVNRPPASSQLRTVHEAVHIVILALDLDLLALLSDDQQT